MVHSGGINAVAMATPGITLVFSFRVAATMPARPPNSAMSTSHRVGVVRASSSLWASLKGVIQKYSAEENTLITTATSRLRAPFRISWVSKIPTPTPTPMMGPMSGEINMAPMITAVEFTFNPTEQITMANIRIHRLVPRNTTFRETSSTTAEYSWASSVRSNRRRTAPGLMN